MPILLMYTSPLPLNDHRNNDSKLLYQYESTQSAKGMHRFVDCVWSLNHTDNLDTLHLSLNSNLPEVCTLMCSR